jgi:hypothetical protein
MKPSFALNFTDEGVTLLHRTARGWLDVGYVAFDNADLPAALEYLRSTALGLSPKGITSKLLIPSSQILYLDVSAPGPDKASKEAQVAAALEGRTPYDVGELAYDWNGEGSAVRVAVVAKETLSEAEAFATEHRFNPVSFAAIPPAGFPQEPFFGPSQLASSLVPKGQELERDVAPIEIVTREMPKADPSEETATEAEVAPESSSDVAPAPVVEKTEVLAPEVPAAEMAAAPPIEPEPEPEVPFSAEAAPMIDSPAPEAQEPAPIMATLKPEDRLEDTPRTFAMDEQKAGLSADVAAIIPPDSIPSAPSEVAKSEVSTAPATTAKPTGPAEPDEAPMAVDVPIEDLPEAPPKPSVLTADLDDIPPAPSTATLMAFSSRRAADMDTQKAAEKPAARVAPMPPVGSASVTASSVPRPAGAKPIAERPAATARPSPKFSYDDPVPPPPRLPGDPPAASVGVMSKAGKGLRSLGTLVSAPGLPGGRKKPTPVPPPSASAPVSPTATAATLKATIVKPAAVATSAKVTRLADVERPSNRSNGAAVAPDVLSRGLGARAVPQRGKPRFLGLIMTGVLLLLLAIVAAWSSFFLAQNEPSVGDASVVASAAGTTQNDAAEAPAPDDEIAADLADQGEAAPAASPQDTAAIDAPAPIDPQLAPANPVPFAEPVASVEPEPAPSVEPVATVEPEPAPEPVATAQAPPPAPPRPEPAPQTGVETQAVSVSVQPGIEGQDEIFLAGMDAPPSFSDPLVLARPATVGDVLPGPQMPPPPFGTVYQFDENGLILPTPEGITTPEGVRLVAGKPPVLPPQRPAAITAAAAPVQSEVAATAEAATANTELTPAQTFAADPALQNARPRLRPEGLAPAAAAAPAGGEDDASLAPAVGSRFASLRPRVRPKIILAAGETARRESEAASLALQAAAAAAAQAVVQEQAQSAANISPLAVTVSRMPAPRPRDLSKAVEVAVAAATRQSEPRAANKPAEPEQHEEADSEPEVVASAAPRIPTRANVAKQATFVNAINLSKTNLIGVYGTQSKRYALIRQANGRYKKVRVGDTVDGGMVQAITATEVRYQKGGRLLTLAMPKT